MPSKERTLKAKKLLEFVLLKDSFYLKLHESNIQRRNP